MTWYNVYTTYQDDWSNTGMVRTRQDSIDAAVRRALECCAGDPLHIRVHDDRGGIESVK